MQLSCFTYDQLSKDTLYAVLKLRQDVFMLEQNSLYSDLDDLDQQAWHFVGEQEQGVIAYARMRWLPHQRQCKIERVIVTEACRGKGYSKALMNLVMETCTQQNGLSTIALSAQLEVLDFYRKWGFETTGVPYDDGGVMHQDMVFEISSL